MRRHNGISNDQQLLQCAKHHVDFVGLSDKLGSFRHGIPWRKKPRWKIPTPGIVNGGTMASPGQLVFQGHVDGTFNAFDANDGIRLWTFKAGISVLGAPISFLFGGQQYVAVLSGPPSGSPAATLTAQAKFGWRYRDHPRRLLVFRLGGTAKLPTPAPAAQAQPLAAPDFKVDAALAAWGTMPFLNYCSGCHGVGAVASGGAPDLRASPVVLDADSFAAVVHGGALKEIGMPAFDFLTDADMLAIRHYVRDQASGAKPAQQVRGP